MNTIVKIDDIQNKIYEIKGKNVMLDSDLAILYNCKNGTKEINQSVRNNPEKFPERFSWILSDEESYYFLVKNFDQKTETRGGRYKNPRVFTEQGVAMLATILKSSVATKTSIQIMDACVTMRHYLSSSLIEQKYINELVLKDSKRIDYIEQTLSGFKEKSNHIFYKGQVYDAYSLLMDIFNKSKIEIVIIDNYIDKKLLDILSETKKDIVIITNKYNNTDYNKYCRQYSNIRLIVNNDYHDRFIIVDRNTIYHCGASFKDLGEKCFSINKIEDKETLDSKLKYLENII